jgi:fluoroacetyl-CoA thioesterase
MQPGDALTRSFTVTPEDTAQALGSGDLPVLGTPRLLAWCEAVTCAVLDRSLEAAQTSVGTRVQLEHLSASAVGAALAVTATLRHVDGRLVRFEVVAQELESSGRGAHPSEPARLVAQGEVTRVVVDRDRFVSRLSR